MASQALPDTEVVKARELVEASFARGSAPTASARKTIALMLQKAAGAAWEPGRLFQITKRELRGSHKGNERLRDVLDEVQRTLIRIETTSPAGRHAVEVVPVLTRRIEETDDAEGAIVWFQFSEAARAAMQGSDHYASLNRAAVLAFESRHAVTLYERGCLLVGRRDRTWRGNVTELREVLGVPPSTYPNWTDLRRFTLDRAVAEVNHLAPFTVSVGEKRRGRQVIEVALAFEPKAAADADAAIAELELSHVGRKARREAQAASPRLQLDLEEALAALRTGHAPPGAAE
ncbi:MAG: replication initiation protein [Pseudomonadota bacterium]|nr:replication initiation protein [Pseudomonadota bacterium]